MRQRANFAYFNSIKVQLKRRSSSSPPRSPPHFNSIKVQLKRSARARRRYDIRFQFHKGTIKARREWRCIIV